MNVGEWIKKNNRVLSFIVMLAMLGFLILLFLWLGNNVALLKTDPCRD
jgi:hypothetical protein